MPDLTANASLFRAGNFRFTGYLGAIAQTVVFSRAVNMATITYPVTAITFDDAYTGAGAYTDVREDMTVLVYNGNTATLKGVLRVAAGGASSTVLQVNEFGKGTLDLADNDRFDVVSEWRVHDKLVEASASLRKDSRITFADQTDDYPPVANGGGAVFAMCDAGQTYATVAFDWTTSFAVDPDNTSGLTYSVDKKDGTITVGTSTSSTCTITFPYGTRWIELTVTDADNSATSVKHIPVDIYHPTLRPPLAVQLDTLSCGNGGQDGWSMTFRLPKGTEAGLSSLPDGALVGYFEDEHYGATNASYQSNAPAGRDALKFVGYLARDSITITPDESDVTFEAVSPLAILEQTAALTQLMIRDQSPDDWQDVKTLTVNRALWYLWYWHSSIAAAFDFLWVDGTDLAYSRLAVEDTSSMAAQLRDIASAIHVQLTADHLGRLLFVRDPHYLSVSDRSGRTTTYALTTADILEAGIDREHRRAVKFVRGEAVTPGTSASDQLPVFSNAPGDAPGEGTATETLSRKIATQTELNRLTGEHYARVNGLYYDESTKAHALVPKGTRLQLPDGYAVFDPAYREFVSLTLASSTNARGVAFTSATKWTVEEVNITYDADAGTKEIEVTLDHETHGVPGTTHVKPQASETGLPTFPPLDLTQPGLTVLPPPVGVTTGTGILLVGNTDGYLYITTDGNTPASAGGPDWLTNRVLASGITGFPGGTLNGGAVRAHSSKYISGGATVDGYVWTTTHFAKLSDSFNAAGGRAFANPQAFAATSARRSGNFERGLDGWGIIASFYGASGVYVWYTTDEGATDSEAQLTSHYDTAHAVNSWRPGIWLDPRGTDKAYTSAFTATGFGTNASADGYLLTSRGASGSAMSSPDLDPNDYPAQHIVVPYASTDGSTVYWTRLTATAGTPPAVVNGRLYRVLNGGAKADISPLVDGVYYGGVWGSSRALAIADDDPNAAILCAYSGGTNDLFAVFLTANLQAADANDVTWTTLVAPSATEVYRSAYMPNRRTAYLLGNNGAVAVVQDGVLDVRTGNISSSGENIFLWGG